MPRIKLRRFFGSTALVAQVALTTFGAISAFGALGAGSQAAGAASTAASIEHPTRIASVDTSTPPAAEPATPSPAGTTLPPLQSPQLPRSGLVASDLAVLIREGDALSEAIGLAYQRARGIPEANMIRVPVPAGSDSISEADFKTVKDAIDARLPATIQATLVTWHQPSRVSGSCTMSLTSALAFGYNPSHCGGCARTQASRYFDTDTTRPWDVLQIRPSMMLGASTLAQAEALIARGVAADGTAPAGTGYLLRTGDAARSVRYPDYPALPEAWSTVPGLKLRYFDARVAAPNGLHPQSVVGERDVMFYFTGLVSVPNLDSNRFLPGAAADHLTSAGGVLPDGGGQMPITAWLAAGATASHGTVEEPCNHVQKFSRASVLIEQYLRGATLIEAYWKSVAWPGQGLFIGEPLARPWNEASSAAIEGAEWVLKTRSLRRGGLYQLDFKAAGASAWTTLASLTAGQPRPITWRVPLPADTAGAQLRWQGPCPTAPSQTCVLAQSP